MSISREHIEQQMREIENRLGGRTRSDRAAIDELDFVAVALIGHEERVPRRDHRDVEELCWPVRIASVKDPKSTLKNGDLWMSQYSLHLLGLVWTRSAADAKRLHEALDRLLLGDEPAADPVGYRHNGGPAIDPPPNLRRLRHAWRSLQNEPEITWPILLTEALREINRRGEQIEVFDDVERQRRIRAVKLRGIA